jgi:hypothetical protein
VNHFIGHWERKHRLARGDFVQPSALEEQEMGIERVMPQSESADEKEKLRIEDLGMGVDRVGRGSVNLPTYREALKN